MDLSRHTELLEGVVNQLIDEEGLGVCLEMHRAIKLGYYELLYPEDSVYEKQVIMDVKGLDIFGCSPLSIKKNIDCLCPNCSRTLGAQKFAPHLEKCMGMGRNSTRLAAIKKPKPTPTVVESEQEGSDDNEDEWTYPDARNSKQFPKKLKKEKLNSPHKSGRGPGRPPKQHKDRSHGQQSNETASKADIRSLKPSQMMHTVHSFKGLVMEKKTSLLDQICGVVSERTGRLCTRSVNCPQHMEEQRVELRSILLPEKLELASPPAKKSRSARKPSPAPAPEAEDVEVEGFPPTTTNNTNTTTTTRHTPHNPQLVRKKKSKSSKKSKRSHGITTTTVLQSSPMYQM